MPFQLHPSQKLVDQFREKPWQGTHPATARFLFIGLDANYGADIERTLPEVFDYHSDGVVFWQRHGVHHPFLMPHYTGSGRKYHQKFAEIGFSPQHANQVSFIEALHLPTVGVNKLTAGDLDPGHLRRLADFIDHGATEYVFMPSGVTNLLRQAPQFRWLPRQPNPSNGALGILRGRRGQMVYQMYHLSCYGWQSGILDRQIGEIRGMLKL
ncbi:hypothetical protein [Geomonas edaphica]|uniref:hypothetical protein n=1 Tax=Geomonas edaphica TaxID=2570226 RepID=UPI0010A80FC4|nr:hypothetical protein [Geomonas edaphica]